jgi:hypothetical protein
MNTIVCHLKKKEISNESAEVVNMRSFVQPEASMRAREIAKHKFNFMIDEDIVNKLIFGLLFNLPVQEGEAEEEENNRSKKNALKQFVHHQENNVFEIEVKSVLKLNMLVANFASIGVSFRQTSRLYQSVKEETGMGVLGSISEGEVAQHCRIVCAINLQYL